MGVEMLLPSLGMAQYSSPDFEKASAVSDSSDDDITTIGGGSKSSFVGPMLHVSKADASIDDIAEETDCTEDRSATTDTDTTTPASAMQSADGGSPCRLVAMGESATNEAKSSDVFRADADKHEQNKKKKWNEEDIEREFAKSAFDFAIPSDESLSDHADRIARLPCRILDDWRLSDANLIQVDGPEMAFTTYRRATMELFWNKPNAKQSCFSNRRIPLPDQNTRNCNMKHPGTLPGRHGHKFLSSLEGYTLSGMLQPMHPQQCSVSVKLTNLVCYAVNHTKEHRGFWIVTPKAKYWLRNPCKKIATIPKLRVCWSGGEDDATKADAKSKFESILLEDAALPSQEDVHQFRRAQLGLFSNVVDSIASEQDLSKHSPEKIHEILSVDKELASYAETRDLSFRKSLRPLRGTTALFCLEFLKRKENARFVHRHLNGTHNGLARSRFMKGLKRIIKADSKGLASSAKVRDPLSYLVGANEQDMLVTCAKQSEKRSRQRPWGESVEAQHIQRLPVDLSVSNNLHAIDSSGGADCASIGELKLEFELNRFTALQHADADNDTKKESDFSAILDYISKTSASSEIKPTTKPVNASVEGKVLNSSAPKLEMDKREGANAEGSVDNPRGSTVTLLPDEETYRPKPKKVRLKKLKIRIRKQAAKPEVLDERAPKKACLSDSMEDVSDNASVSPTRKVKASEDIDPAHVAKKLRKSSEERDTIVTEVSVIASKQMTNVSVETTSTNVLKKIHSGPRPVDAATVAPSTPKAGSSIEKIESRSILKKPDSAIVTRKVQDVAVSPESNMSVPKKTAAKGISSIPRKLEQSSSGIPKKIPQQNQRSLSASVSTARKTQFIHNAPVAPLKHSGQAMRPPPHSRSYHQSVPHSRASQHPSPNKSVVHNHAQFAQKAPVIQTRYPGQGMRPPPPPPLGRPYQQPVPQSRSSQQPRPHRPAVQNHGGPNGSTGHQYSGPRGPVGRNPVPHGPVGHHPAPYGPVGHRPAPHGPVGHNSAPHGRGYELTEPNQGIPWQQNQQQRGGPPNRHPQQRVRPPPGPHSVWDGRGERHPPSNGWRR